MEGMIFGINYVPLLQILLAMFLGILLGTERTLAHKTAGMRTFGLVSMGSALFIVTALAALPELQETTRIDIMRVVSGVVTGVGFLGAGIIIFKENTITGITTAAGIWISAGIGVATAFGFYVIAIFSTVLTILAFTLFWHLEEEVREMRNDVDIKN